MTIRRGDTERAPTPPSVFIAEDILSEYGLTQEALAKALGVSRRTISQLVNARRMITAEMALKLGKFTDTTPQFWLNLQMSHDLWMAEQKTRDALERIVSRAKSAAA
jgi:addiction module HigA family antidote